MLLVKKRSFILLSLLVALIFALSGCGGSEPGPAKKQIVLKLGHEMPENHPYHAGAMKFAELLAQKTNNEVTVQIFPNGTLGKQAQLIEGLTMGTVDLSLTNTVVLEKYEPLMSVLAMPYIVNNWEQLYKAVDGDIGKELNEKLEKKGVTVLAYHEIGTININSIKPVQTPADVKGLKLRVQPGPSSVELGRALGAVVATTAYSEVYTALQLGTIDAQTQSVSNMLANKHYEVAKYLALNELCFYLEPLSMSKQVLDKMTPAQKTALQQAAYESALWQRQYAREKYHADLEELQKKHGVIVENCQIADWAAVVEPIHEKFPAQMEIIQRIKAVK